MTAPTEEPTERRSEPEPATAATPRPRRWLGSGLSGTARVLLLLVVVVGFGFLASRSEPAAAPQGPPNGDVAQAAQAVESMSDPATSADALHQLPADFAEVTGSAVGHEQAMDGTVRTVNTDGGCSAPWGDDSTRWDFGAACRSHDLGYDLLRYADGKGQPLPPEARESLDTRLAGDMRATCEANPRGTERACEAVAGVYTAGLEVNSWHQRWGPPVPEAIGPLLAGVAAIGVLLAFRLRTWRAARRARPSVAEVPAAPAPAPRAGRWTLLGVAAIGAIVLGESAVTVARWAGVDESWLWPATWLTQLAFVFFFAGGHRNLAGWLGVRNSGGGYREYLAHRTSWLLRMALVFALVAFTVPTALELMGVPPTTIEIVVRIALHPLWLLGVYVLTTVATPLMHAVHRRVPILAWTGLGGALAALLVLADRTGSPLVDGFAALALALLAQQLAFAHAARTRRRPWVPALGAVAAGAALTVAVARDAVPQTILGTTDGPPPLAGPVLPVLLLGLVQLSLLGLLRRPLAALADNTRLRAAAGRAAQAPMSLYLLFLAAMTLLVAAVYIPDLVPSGSPRVLVAVGMLAGPALAVFWWFERHNGRPHPVLPRSVPPVPPVPTGRLDRVLAQLATTAGIGYSTIGVFGFAVTSFIGDALLLPELPLDPIQSLVLLLLGMSLLHTVRTGDSHSPRTWLLTALACVPPLLSATTSPEGSGTFTAGAVVLAGTGVLAVLAILATVWAARWAPGPGRATIRT
ncbi:phospholipase [Saccharomonospora sp. CUA-673]|uniref:phospholipase A2 n=1 Tax=Saccharomonospora sp. CUA-673 TaxID=1904969 RepID=UPI000968C031|nr:phospholipase A2 [Saccharomonospora sp. CUA-673]OLT43672.1 phospholipase [Saccharomonospora sp. CUA-673]